MWTRPPLPAVVVLTAGRATAALISAAWLLVAARLLSVGEFGSLALLLTSGMIAGAIADAGLASEITDLVAASPRSARAVFLRAMRTRAPLTVIAIAVFLVIYGSGADRPDAVTAALFCGSIVGTLVYATATAVLRGVGRSNADAVNEVTSRMGVLAIGSVLLGAGGGVRAAAATYALADVASGVVLLWVVLRLKEPDRATVPPFPPRRVLALMATAVLGVTLYRLDSWIIALFHDDRLVGLYAGAYRILDGSLIPATAVGLLAVGAYRRVADQPDLWLVRRATAAMVVTAVIAAAVVMLASPFLRISLGPDFVAAAPMLRVLLASAPPSAFILVVFPRLVLKRPGAALGLVGGVLVGNVIANLLVVPTHAGLGAAWVTVGTQAVLALLTLRLFTAGGAPATAVRARGLVPRR